MLKAMSGVTTFKKLNVVSASVVSERGDTGREWVCHTKSGKMFHLIYQAGVLQASNVVEAEYDLELNSKPIATMDDLTEILLHGFGKKNRNTVTFKDIINLMGWEIDDDQWFD